MKLKGGKKGWGGSIVIVVLQSALLRRFCFIAPACLVLTSPHWHTHTPHYTLRSHPGVQNPAAESCDFGGTSHLQCGPRDWERVRGVDLGGCVPLG